MYQGLSFASWLSVMTGGAIVFWAGHGTLAKLDQAQTDSVTEVIRCVGRFSRLLLQVLRLWYIAAALCAWYYTGQSRWTIDFSLAGIAFGCFGNGMSTREDGLALAVAHVLLLPCLFQSTDGTSPASKCLAAAIHVVLMVMAYYSTRIETAGHLSTWIGLQLLAKQRMRMGEILNKLLPPDMVDLVLAQHFQQGNEPLPIKLCRKRKAIVLHLDLKNYTGLANSVDPSELAHHVDAIFRSFDRLVYSAESRAQGLFKIDTIGDAYEAAAWLSEETNDLPEGTDEADARQRRVQMDGEVCSAVVKVAWAMIDVVKRYAAQQETTIECRIGIANGQVLAGMLGKLQPRFHLMGEAVWEAHRHECNADVNTVRVGDDVQGLLADFLPALISVERGKEKKDKLTRRKKSVTKEMEGRRREGEDAVKQEVAKEEAD